MYEEDFYELTEKEAKYIEDTEQLYLRREEGDILPRPLVFLHLDTDQVSGRIKGIGAFFPEGNYIDMQKQVKSGVKISKAEGFVRRGSQGKCSFFTPIRPRQCTQEFREFQAMNQVTTVYQDFNGKLIRCLEEEEALLKFLQFLVPIKFSLHNVTLVSFSEQDIKLLLNKISEYNLTQQFMTVCNDFITLLQVLALPKVPSCLDELISTRYPQLICLLGNSVQKARALSHALLNTNERDNLDVNRKDFSILEEFFHMNYSVKLDEGNEDNVNLYLGDLALTVSDSDVYSIIQSLCGVSPCDFKLKMCRHPKTRMFLGYAYAQFENHDTALRVLSRVNNEVLKNKPIRIVWQSKDAISYDKSRSNLFVKNLGIEEVDQKRLYDTFRVFGKILSAKVALDNRGVSKGFGFVQFDEQKNAQRAINVMHNIWTCWRVPGAKTLQWSKLFVTIKLSDEERKRERNQEISQNPGNLVHVQIYDGESLDPDTLIPKFSFGPINVIKTSQDFSSMYLLYEHESDSKLSVQALNNTELNGSRLEVKFLDWRTLPSSDLERKGKMTQMEIPKGENVKEVLPRKVPVPPIDQKSFLSNKIQNALRKKLKEGLAQNAGRTVTPEPATKYTNFSSPPSNSQLSSAGLPVSSIQFKADNGYPHFAFNTSLPPPPINFYNNTPPLNPEPRVPPPYDGGYPWSYKAVNEPCDRFSPGPNSEFPLRQQGLTSSLSQYQDRQPSSSQILINSSPLVHSNTTLNSQNDSRVWMNPDQYSQPRSKERLRSRSRSRSRSHSRSRSRLRTRRSPSSSWSSSKRASSRRSRSRSFDQRNKYDYSTKSKYGRKYSGRSRS